MGVRELKIIEIRIGVVCLYGRWTWKCLRSIRTIMVTCILVDDENKEFKIIIAVMLLMFNNIWWCKRWWLYMVMFREYGDETVRIFTIGDENGGV
jgi:hypothetical protein